MQEILLVNPRKRRKASAKKRRSQRRQSPAQRAAFAKMIAARRGGSSKRRRSARRRAPVLSIMSNPRRRRSASRRSYRRNPSRRGGTVRSVTSAFRHPGAMIAPALTGAVGAVVVNKVLSMLPVPPVLMTGRMRYVTQAAAAVALGALAGRFVGRQRAGAAVAGALTITMYDVVRDVAAQAGVNLSGMGYYLPGVGVQAVPSAAGRPSPQLSGVGKYLTGPGSPGGNVLPINRGGMAGMGKVNTFRF